MTEFVKFDYPVEWNELPRYERKKKIKELKHEAELKTKSLVRFKRWLIFVLIGLVLTGGFILLTRKTPEQVKFEEEVKSVSLEGRVQEFPIEGRDHVAQGADVSYKTNPPTSGPHYPVPQPWGVYEKEIPDGAAVHGLEHGGIWISYKDINDEQRKVLEQIGKENAGSVIVSPRSSNDVKIAVVSWGRMMKLDSSDKALIQKYIDTYKNKAPEKLAD